MNQNLLKYSFAKASSLQDSQTVLFEAAFQGAGTSETLLADQLKAQSNAVLSSAQAIFQVENRDPSVTQNLLSNIRLFHDQELKLLGDLANQEKQFHKYVSELVRKNKKWIAVGGDHLLKYHSIKAAAQKTSRMGCLYIDAHPDCALRSTLRFDSILTYLFQEKVLSPSDVNLFGLRQISESEKEGLLHFKPGMLTGLDLRKKDLSTVIADLKKNFASCSGLYVSIDLDGICPHECPAVEALVPGGPGIETVIACVQEISKIIPIVAVDLTEFLPAQDHQFLTAASANILLKEISVCL